jgi:hypothetical protein
VQLVEHVCHCDDASVDIFKVDKFWEGSATHNGQKCRSNKTAACFWGLKVRRAGQSGSVQLVVGVVRGRSSKVDSNGCRWKKERFEEKWQKEAHECQ